jgi:hypothetical protein
MIAIIQPAFHGYFRSPRSILPSKQFSFIRLSCLLAHPGNVKKPGLSGRTLALVEINRFAATFAT